MRIYPKKNKNKDNKNQISTLLSFTSYLSSDEILLDTDIYFEECSYDIFMDKQNDYEDNDSINYYD